MDIRTLFVVIGLVYLLVPVAVFYSVLAVRDKSSNLWCLSWIAFGTGALLIGLRGNLPDLISFQLAHLLMLAGYIWRSESILLEINPQREGSWASRNIRLFVAAGYMVLFLYMLSTNAPENIRIGVVNIFFVIFFFDTLFLSLRLRKSTGYAGTRLLIIMSVFFIIGFGMRSIGALTNWGGHGAFGAGTDQIVIMLSGLMGFIVGNFGFIQLRTEKLMRQTKAIGEELKDTKQTSQTLAAVLKEKNSLLKQLAISTNAVRSGIAASTVTHELSQPLHAMALNLDYVRRKIAQGADSASLAEAIEDISKDSHRANETLNRVRALFMRGSEDFQQFNFSEAVSDVLSITGPRAALAAIDVRADIQPNIQVIGDAVQLRMLLTNLISNAIEALEESAHPKKIDCSLQFKDGLAVFDIKDSGPGVAENKAQDIFDLYASTKTHGSGVGLWLCRLIAENHKGAIQYKRAELGGAHFSLSLPFAMA